MELMQERIDYLKKHLGIEFTAQQMRAQRFFPWALNDRTIVKLIERDRCNENVLHSWVDGVGRQRRYIVKGRYIIKYIEKYGPALMVREGKPKRHNEKTAEAKGTAKKARKESGTEGEGD